MVEAGSSDFKYEVLSRSSSQKQYDIENVVLKHIIKTISTPFLLEWGAIFLPLPKICTIFLPYKPAMFLMNQFFILILQRRHIMLPNEYTNVAKRTQIYRLGFFFRKQVFATSSPAMFLISIVLLLFIEKEGLLSN